MLDPPWPRTISEMKLFVIRGVPKACIIDFTSCKGTTLLRELPKSEQIPKADNCQGCRVLLGRSHWKELLWSSRYRVDPTVNWKTVHGCGQWV
jgi:hypothetical protein